MRIDRCDHSGRGARDLRAVPRFDGAGGVPEDPVDRLIVGLGREGRAGASRLARFHPFRPWLARAIEEDDQGDDKPAEHEQSGAHREADDQVEVRSTAGRASAVAPVASRRRWQRAV